MYIHYEHAHKFVCFLNFTPKAEIVKYFVDLNIFTYGWLAKPKVQDVIILEK